MKNIGKKAEVKLSSVMWHWGKQSTHMTCLINVNYFHWVCHRNKQQIIPKLLSLDFATPGGKLSMELHSWPWQHIQPVTAEILGTYTAWHICCSFPTAEQIHCNQLKLLQWQCKACTPHATTHRKHCICAHCILAVSLRQCFPARGTWAHCRGYVEKLRIYFQDNKKYS